jgi:hypothetical protein
MGGDVAASAGAGVLRDQPGHPLNGPDDRMQAPTPAIEGAQVPAGDPDELDQLVG